MSTPIAAAAAFGTLPKGGHAAFSAAQTYGTQCVYAADGSLVCPGSSPAAPAAGTCAGVAPVCWLSPKKGGFQCSPAPANCTSAAECAARGINGMTVLRR